MSSSPLIPSQSPAHWTVAPTPPMGWNSYDAFGSSVTEEEFLANAGYVREHLLPHGWEYVVVDFRWSDATAADYDPNGRAGLPLEMDAFGRLMPAPERFPSAAGGGGFRPLADKVHAMGLKFGIHLMRGIPRIAVAANTPIEGSRFRAADAADLRSHCAWCADMWGVDAGTRAGRDYYDSLFRLYASWEVDFVKVDDLSQPYSAAEVEAVRNAIDKAGRPMVFSTSPGDTPLDHAHHVAANANMWRVSADFWDNWKSLRNAFELAAAWQAHIGPGHWPDLDMIPFGKIGIRCVGKPRMCEFTRDEQVALMSLWCIARSPLMLGGNLPEIDPFSLSLATNPEVLAVHRTSTRNRQLFHKDHLVAWVAGIPGSADHYLAVFNLRDGIDPARIPVRLHDIGMEGPCTVRDLWRHKDLGTFAGEFAPHIPSHGAGLYRVSPE